MDAYDDLARLRAAKTGVDLAGGELNGGGLPEFAHVLEKRCLDVYQPDATFPSGIAAPALRGPRPPRARLAHPPRRARTS